MSRIGYYYRPDSQHYRAKDLERWLPVLQELAAGWVVLRASEGKRVPDFFIKTLIGHGLQPIIHIPNPSEPFDLQEIKDQFGAYAELGIQHVVFFDQLNSRSAWSSREWSQPGIVDRATRKLLPVLEAQLASGLHPTIPPLQQGGDYWDLAFLTGLLSTIVRDGSPGLFENLTIACYGWDFGHGAHWGAGGPAAWPQAQPYVCPPGSENQVGARAFEWYGLIAKKALGSQPQVIVLAGGCGPQVEHRASPTATAETHAQIISDIGRSGPEWLKCFCFYTLTAGEDPAHKPFALSTDAPPAQSVALPLEPAPKTAVAAQGKSLRHYLLLPRDPMADSAAWEKAKGYVQAFQPAVGFSPQEASLAERVTLAGGEEIFPSELEESLRRGGSIVERLSLRPTFSEQQISGHAKRADVLSAPGKGACHD